MVSLGAINPQFMDPGLLGGIVFIGCVPMTISANVVMTAVRCLPYWPHHSKNHAHVAKSNFFPLAAAQAFFLSAIVRSSSGLIGDCEQASASYLKTPGK